MTPTSSFSVPGLLGRGGLPPRIVSGQPLTDGLAQGGSTFHHLRCPGQGDKEGGEHQLQPSAARWELRLLQGVLREPGRVPVQGRCGDGNHGLI